MQTINYKILIVDDEESQRLILGKYISSFGYQFYEASSGYEAIDTCKIISPDLILLDLIMPEIDGIETCNKLRKDPNTSNIPIVILTGKDDSNSIIKSFEAGANDFLIKPINDTLLIKRINSSINENKLRTRLQEREKELIEAQKIAKLGTIRVNIKEKNIDISSNCYDLLGLEKKDIKLTFKEFLSHVHPDDIEHVRFILNYAIDNHTHYMLEYRFINKNNKEFIIYQQGEFIKDNKDKLCLFGSFQDVTESRRTQDNLEHNRYYDSLTELPNKNLFISKLRKTIKNPPCDSLFTVIFIGIDNFSRVNDQLGHQGGDIILKELANRLRNYEHSDNIISRFGGDVFTMLVTNLYHIDECSELLKDVLHSIKKPIIINSNEIHVTASIGASVFPLESEEETQLIIGAEAAMMFSREEGGNRFTYRTHRMNLETQRHFLMLKEMRTAIKNNEFTVYYQPQIDAKSMKIVGMEALVRWIHPEKGIIPPDVFIPIAEDSGLIIPIGDFVIKQACKDTKNWIDMGYNLDVGVNISAQQFETNDFITKVIKTLEETELPNKHLEIEITESMAMKDYQLTVDILTELRSLNIKASMDDFGTGYSSLSQLQTLPLDTLKVDQAFVKCITSNNKDDANHYENSAIANAIIAMSHSLGLRVIAEGVETIEQCTFLQEQKSEMLQGYLFSKPLPAIQFEDMLIDNKARINYD